MFLMTFLFDCVESPPSQTNECSVDPKAKRGEEKLEST